MRTLIVRTSNIQKAFELVKEHLHSFPIEGKGLGDYDIKIINVEEKSEEMNNQYTFDCYPK